MRSEDRPAEPLVQLARSHRRLEEACAALEEATRRRDIETALEVATFFARQGRRHEDDEETSLFPRLTTPEARALVERLAAEHREHESLVAKLDEALSGRAEGDLWETVARLGHALATAYRGHIALEENELFPLAEHLLDEAARAAIHEEMQARRGR